MSLLKEKELIYQEKLVDIDNLISKFRNKNASINNPFWIAKCFNYEKSHSIQWLIKRIFDFTASFTGIILIFPVLLIIVLAIKLDSKGSAIFKQKRIGLNGKEFYMYKFRSMKLDAEKELEKLEKFNETNDGMFKLFNDPRVTKVGKFIRKYSIDELPQLFNVLKGEMSLVGPRPPIGRELEVYKNWHYIRFATLPGLTGLWQVSGRSKIVNFDDVVKLDYEYVNKWSLLLDMKILLKTIPVVIFGKDAA